MSIAPPKFTIHKDVIMPQDSSYDEGMQMLKIPLLHKAYDFCKGDKDFVIGIIDDGHTDHVDNSEPISVKQRGQRSTASAGGHGVMVQGIINMNGVYIGVVPECPIRQYKFMGKTGKFPNLAQCIHDAIDDGCRIINISAGASKEAYDKDTDEACKRAWSLHIPVFISSGNSNQAVGFPSWLREVFSIGAIDFEKKKALFSNKGDALDFVSFGDLVITTVLGKKEKNGKYSGVQRVSGTSFSSPYATGCAAMMMIAYERWFGTRFSCPELMSMMRFYAEDLNKLGFDANTGYGLITVEAIFDKFSQWRADAGITKPIEIESPKKKKSKTCFDKVDASLEPLRKYFSFT